MAAITATAALTVDRANAWLNHILRAATDTPPSSVYVMLLTAAPDDSGTYSEVTGGSYARQAAAFASAALRESATSATITFTAVPAGAITWVGLIDAATGGTLIAAGPVVDPVAGNPTSVDPGGDDLVINIGDLTMTVAYGTTSGMSEALANAMLDHQLRSESYTPATSTEVSLWDDLGAEVTSVGRDAVTWAAAAASLSATSSATSWEPTPAVTIAEQRLHEDAASGAMHLWTWEITPKSVGAGSSVGNAVGGLTCNID